MGNRDAVAELGAVDAAALKDRLRKAMDAEQFVLHYQPKVDLASGALCGLEALMRWQDPRSGLVGPEVFIPLLEDTDLIVDVGNWAIRHALSQRLAWHIAGLRPPRISVNVSPVQIRQPDFADTICESLGSVGVGAPGLELELSEAFFLDELEDHSGTLCAIGDQGVNFAMDDCGTGGACFEHLAQLPVTELKIDRPYVAGMAADAGDLATVSRVISLAHSRNMTVVAEGVESEAQRSMLRALGCDRIQGYLASRPLPAAEAARWLLQAQGPPRTQ